MSVKLELRKVDSDQHAILYRYNIDDKYLVWFKQYQDNGKSRKDQNLRGCVFSVSVQPLDGEMIPLQVYESVDSHLGYPDTFAINWAPPTITLDNFEEIRERLEGACQHLRVLKDIFYTRAGVHWQLFETRGQSED